MNEEIKRLTEEARLAGEKVAATALPAAENAVASGWDKQTVLILSISLLVFGLITLGMITFLILRSSQEIVLQAFALPLIIISAIFLVVTGYSQQQISPVIGLLGTIAGYILGRGAEELATARRSASQSPTPTQPPAATP